MFVQRLMRLDKLSEPRVQSVVKLQLEVSPFLFGFCLMRAMDQCTTAGSAS